MALKEGKAVFNDVDDKWLGFKRWVIDNKPNRYTGSYRLDNGQTHIIKANTYSELRGYISNGNAKGNLEFIDITAWNDFANVPIFHKISYPTAIETTLLVEKIMATLDF